MKPLWRVEMLGTLQAKNQDTVVSRFRTRRVGSLLAYLAFYKGQSHDRAEIGDMLWPEADPDHIGTNFRQALTKLRRQMEPPPTPSGSAIRTQNASITIDADVLETDVAEFEAAVAKARNEKDPGARKKLL